MYVITILFVHICWYIHKYVCTQLQVTQTNLSSYMKVRAVITAIIPAVTPPTTAPALLPPPLLVPPVLVPRVSLKIIKYIIVAHKYK